MPNLPASSLRALDAPGALISYTIEELAQIASVPVRTLRFYLQQGLVDKPEGQTRAARYGARHLEQLLTIRKWQDAGLSLERIAELLRQGDSGDLPPPRQVVGSVSVRSHIHLGVGLELVIDPEQAGLRPEHIRVLAKEIAERVAQLKESE